MTSRFVSFFAALSVLLGAPAFANDLKIGVVDMQAVLKGTTAGKAAAKKFEDVRDRKKASLEKSGKDLQKREKTLLDKRNEIMQKAQELQGKPPGDDLKQRMAALEAEAKKFDADSMDFEMAKQKAVEELGHKEAELRRGDDQRSHGEKVPELRGRHRSRPSLQGLWILSSGPSPDPARPTRRPDQPTSQRTLHDPA